MIVAVKIKQSTTDRLILVEALLEPVISLSESIVRPIDFVLCQPFQIFWAFTKMHQQVEKNQAVPLQAHQRNSLGKNRSGL
jgi:hypothetical protein